MFQCLHLKYKVFLCEPKIAFLNNFAGGKALATDLRVIWVILLCCLCHRIHFWMHCTPTLKLRDISSHNNTVLVFAKTRTEYSLAFNINDRRASE